MEKIDLWWSALAIEQMESIVYNAFIRGGDKSAMVMWQYPNCKTWWQTLPAVRKEWLYAHCRDKKGKITSEWQEYE